MGRCGFIFDFVVVRVDVANVQIEENNALAVDANFNNVTLRITPSRINVVEFKPKRSFEFESTPADLKRDLSICPLTLKVFYNNEVIGTATIPWQDCFLDRIVDNMGEINHIDECELINNESEERVGTLEFIARLQMKCDEGSDDLCAQNIAGYDLKKHINRIIDPHDILFVVAEPNKEDVCNVRLTDELDMDCGGSKPVTALDLSPYRLLNGRLVQTTDAVNTCHNVECCDLMRTSHQYQKLIEALNPCKKSAKCSKRKCQAIAHCNQCPHHEKFSSHSDTSSEASICVGPCNCLAAEHHTANVFGGRKAQRVNVCPPAMPLPDDTVHDFKVPRYCPVCKEDMKWLPKLATCAKCGYKPVPVYVEKPHDEDVTADQVLQEFLNNRSSGSDIDISKNYCEKKSECRCKCVKGKTCANCRVRQLCGGIIDPPADDEEECGKCEEEEDELYRLCTTSSKDCRPHLARVFSELKDLFDASTPKPEPEPYNEKCERELNPMPIATSRGTSVKRPSPADAKKSQCLPCPCSEPKRRRKRFTKRRGQGRKNFHRPICKPAKCEPPIPQREDRIQKFHDDCVSHRKNVPSNMGWLWNANTELGPRWRPGAIRKPIKEIMRYFLRDFPADTIPVSKYRYRRGHGKGDEKTEEEEDLVQQPTLQICKKNGVIYVTLRPLKNSEALQHCANPYLNMKPIQFKIVKNPLAAEISKMKRCLKDMGFSKCTCHKPLIECFCRTFLDKKRLEYQIKKECRKRGLDEGFCENLIVSDTSDSEVEYDFGVTPPAGLIKPNRAKKPDKVNVATQYELCDWNVPPAFPLPPNTYMKWINCATGHKYAYRRASDLLTIGQKEAIACKKKKYEEAVFRKKRSKKVRALAAAAAAAAGALTAATTVKEDTVQTCPDGSKVEMKKYLDPKKDKFRKK